MDRNQQGNAHARGRGRGRGRGRRGVGGTAAPGTSRSVTSRKARRWEREMRTVTLQPATSDKSIQTDLGGKKAANRLFAASACVSIGVESWPQAPPLERSLRKRSYLEAIDPIPDFETESEPEVPEDPLMFITAPVDSLGSPLPFLLSSQVPSPIQFMETAESPTPSTSMSDVEGHFIDAGSDDEDEMGAGENANPVLRVMADKRSNRSYRMYNEHSDSEDDNDEELPGTEVLTDLGRSIGTYTGEDHLGDIHPQGMMEFDWRSFPEPSGDYSPKSRREDFSKSTGPIASYANPYAAFVAIWDKRIVEHIVQQTNLYAQQLANMRMDGNGSKHELSPKSRIINWKDTNIDEVYVYFAIIMAMGIVIKKTYESYWERDGNIFSTPGFSAHMSLARFQELNRCLHFNNNEAMHSGLPRGDAKLYKIQPIIDHLNERFSTLFTLDRNISLDESLVLWRGWSNIKQFIKNKAAGVGIKTYEVCDSTTGYLWRFLVHAAKLPEGDSNVMPRGLETSIPTLVLKLLEGLEYTGHTIWMDNYYNSPALARYLKAHGLDSVGTVRTNRLYVPAQFSCESMTPMDVGDIIGVTAGDVDLVLWQDRARVALISTYHGNLASKKKGEYKPNVVRDYNHRMGGVDKKDQMLSGYPLERKGTKCWYKKFFRRLLNVSIHNAFILYRENPPPDIYRESNYNFRTELIEQLLMIHSKPVVRRPVTEARVTPGHVMVDGCRKFERSKFHCLRKAVNPSGNVLRRKCRFEGCTKRSIYHCGVCNLFFCGNQCFIEFHTY